MFEEHLSEFGAAFFLASIPSPSTRAAVMGSAGTFRMLRLPLDWQGTSSAAAMTLVTRSSAALTARAMQTARPSLEAFRTYLAAFTSSSSYDLAVTAPPAVMASAAFLSMFFRHAGGLRSVRLIHPLAAALSWFSTAFSGRVSLLDIRDGVTVAAAIELRLPMAVRPSASATLASLTTLWAEMHAEIGSCGPSAQLPVFDSVSSPFRLSDVLHVPGEPLCTLAAVLQDRLLPLVNDLLGASELRALRSSTGEVDGVNYLCSNAEEEALTVDVLALPRNPADAARVLLAYPLAWGGGEGRVASDDFDSALASYVSAHATRRTPSPSSETVWEFDLPAIAAHVLSHYIAGRPALELRAVLRAAEVRVLLAPKPSSSIAVAAADEDVYHADEVVLRLRLAAEQVKRVLGDDAAPPPCDADRRVARGATARATEANLNELLSDLLTTCDAVLRGAAGGAVQRSRTLRDILLSSGLPGGGPLAKKLSRFSLCAGLSVSALPFLAEAVADSVAGQVGWESCVESGRLADEPTWYTTPLPHPPVALSRSGFLAAVQC